MRAVSFPGRQRVRSVPLGRKERFLLTSILDLGYIKKFYGISTFVSPWLPWLYNKEEYQLMELCSVGREREFAVLIRENLYIERRE